MYSGVYGVDEFNAAWIFKGAKGVAMANKFWQNKPKLHKFQLCARNWGMFRMHSRVYEVDEFTYAIWIFKVGKGGVIIATPLPPCNSVDPTMHAKHSRFLAQNCNLCNFVLFLSKFGCRGNTIAPQLEILDSTFEFADPKNLTIRAKNSSTFCTELKSVQFRLIFVPQNPNYMPRGPENPCIY